MGALPSRRTGRGARAGSTRTTRMNLSLASGNGIGMSSGCHGGSSFSWHLVTVSVTTGSGRRPADAACSAHHGGVTSPATGSALTGRWGGVLAQRVVALLQACGQFEGLRGGAFLDLGEAGGE